MPNHTQNILNFKNKKDFEIFKTIAVNEKKLVDFNILVPMPQDLKITKGSKSFNVKSTFLTTRSLLITYLSLLYNNKISQKDYITKVLETLKTNEEEFKVIDKEYGKDINYTIAGYFNLQRYHYQDWYDWAYDFWGTKWNAYECEIDEKNLKCSFQTAWNAPMPWIVALSQHTDFTLKYTIEGDNNIYKYTFLNGTNIYYSKSLISYYLHNEKSIPFNCTLKVKGNLKLNILAKNKKEALEKTKKLAKNIDFGILENLNIKYKIK